MRLALLMLSALALASCSAAAEKPSAVAQADQTASEIRTLRSEGICFDDQSGTNLAVHGVMDWWIISFSSSSVLKDVTAAVSWNPPVPPEMDAPLRDFRKNRKGNGIFPLGDDELIAVPKNYEIPYIHFFGGTAEGRRAAAKLVTFCKP